MSRLFDALQAARPDITDRFEDRAEHAGEPAPTELEVPQGRFHDQFSKLLERLDNDSEAAAARTIGFAGIQGGEGATTVVREFAHFIATDLQAATVVLEIEMQSGADAMLHIDLPEGSAGEGLQRSYASATLTVPDKGRATADEISALLGPLADRYQWILIDSPAVLAGAGSMATLAALESVIVVAEAERTHARDLQRAAQTARAAGANVVGMILNKRPNRIPRLFRGLLRRLHLA